MHHELHMHFVEYSCALKERMGKVRNEYNVTQRTGT
jgi:hypothetical protein